jgi:hypothetical protein
MERNSIRSFRSLRCLRKGRVGPQQRRVLAERVAIHAGLEPVHSVIWTNEVGRILDSKNGEGGGKAETRQGQALASMDWEAEERNKKVTPPSVFRTNLQALSQFLRFKHLRLQVRSR